MLHAADGECGRQYQQVVAVPSIRPEGLLGGLEHRLGVGKLGRGCIEHLLFRVHAGAFAHRPEFQVADGEGHEVGRDWLRHAE